MAGMQKRRVCLAIGLWVLAVLGLQTVTADEGMWLPYRLSAHNYHKMQSLGLQLPMDSLYSNTLPSMKDAIVSLNSGSCTGSFVSMDGLVLTNHHCVVDDVQYHSSVTNNYLEDGFWALDRGAELPNPGKTASILVEVVDVTREFLEGFPAGITENRRLFLTDSIREVIISRCEADSLYSAEVFEFYEGSQFSLFLSQVFEDVRLVATPPSAISQFGGEEDNWMYPRHSADFALLRVYTGPDGKPAPYSDQNVPYHPRKILPIRTEGILENDFTMVMGFPGNTQRYLSSYGVEEIEQVVNPVVREVREMKQTIWAEGMAADPAIKIKYASKLDESANYWKYAIGQNIAIGQQGIIQHRRELEKRFESWLEDNPEKSDIQGQILPALGMIHAMKRPMARTGLITMEALASGPDLFLLGVEALYFKTALEASRHNADQRKLALEEFRESVQGLMRTSDMGLDQKVFVAMLDYYRNNLHDSMRVTDQELFGSRMTNNSQQLAAKIYSQSILTSQERFNQFMANPEIGVLKRDPALQFVEAILTKYGEAYYFLEEMDTQIKGYMRQYIQGLMEMDPDRAFYPDANSTLRLSSGMVQSYQPKDGVMYKHTTTTDGLLQKLESDPLNYQVPAGFQQLLARRDFGRYQAPDGTMPVCFITSNDITGGNSGSPVINGQGELVGLAFDGNWEGMGSDLEYGHAKQKCINVDVRYILFILDQYANARNLLVELGLEPK